MTSKSQMPTSTHALLPFLAGLKVNPDLSNPDWDTVLQYHRWNRTAPLLYFRLKENNLLGSVPPKPVQILQNTWTQSVQRSLRFQEAFIFVQRILEKEEIPFIVLKGMALRYLSYPNPACKPMADIDLLIPQDKLEKAYQKLIDAGLKKSYAAETLFMHDLRHHLPPLQYKDVNFELHRHILSPSERGTYPVSHLFDNSTDIKIPGLHYRMLSPQMNLFALSYHIISHYHAGYVRLIWLFDLYFLLKKYDKIISPDLHRELVTNAGVDSMISTLPDKIRSLFENPENTDQFQQHLLSRTTPVSPIRTTKVFHYLEQLNTREKILLIFSKLFPSPEYLKYRYRIKKKGFATFFYPILYLDYLKKIVLHLFRKLS